VLDARLQGSRPSPTQSLSQPVAVGQEDGQLTEHKPVPVGPTHRYPYSRQAHLAEQKLLQKKLQDNGEAAFDFLNHCRADYRRRGPGPSVAQSGAAELPERHRNDHGFAALVVCQFVTWDELVEADDYR
jgi:hypothetical protein